MSKWYKSNLIITEKLRPYIDGLLLGDGSISSQNNNTGLYEQHCIYKEWLDKIKVDFSLFAIESKIGSETTQSSKWMDVSSFSYRLSTKYYIEFKEMKKMWYKPIFYEDKDGYEYFKYKKTVPKDIQLTPECVANWYMGDGDCHKHNYNKRLSSCGFNNEDVYFLSNLLNNTLDIESYVDKRNTITIGKLSDRIEFLNYIKDFKVSCYDYKFKEKPYDLVYTDNYLTS